MVGNANESDFPFGSDPFMRFCVTSVTHMADLLGWVLKLSIRPAPKNSSRLDNNRIQECKWSSIEAMCQVLTIRQDPKTKRYVKKSAMEVVGPDCEKYTPS